VLAGFLSGTVELASERTIEDVIDQRWNFPEPETPVTTVIKPSGNVTSRFFRLFSRAPRIEIAWPLAWRRSGAHLDLDFAGDVGAVRESGSLMMSAGVSAGDQVAAVPPGAGTQVDDVVGAAGWFLRRARRPGPCCPDRAGFRARPTAGCLSRW